MPDLPEFGAQAVIDTTQWDRDVSKILADAARIDQELKSLEQSFMGLGGGVDVKIDANMAGDFDTARRALDDLDAGVTSEIKFDTIGDDVQGTLDDLDAGVASEIDLKMTGESEVLSTLDDIRGKLDAANKSALIDLVFNVPAAFDDFVNTITNLSGIGTLIELDTAMQELEGRTGRMIPGARELIVDLWTNAWGDSIDDVENVITTASNLGIEMSNLQEATEAAFNLEALGIGEAEENLRALDNMVKTGLAASYTEAADILAAGFQTGADRGQDLLDTFNEYATTFREAGVSGEGALALINSGLEAGIDNSDRIADAIRETSIRLSEIGNDPNIAEAFRQLDELSDIDLEGLRIQFEAGDISGDEFYGAFFQALEDAAAADTTKAKNLAATLVGTIAEDFGVEAVSQLTPVWDESVYGPLEDRAQTASDTINNTLSTALTELSRTIQNEFATTLDESFDIQGLIDRAKQAAKDFAAALREGEGFGEALEVALQVPGLAEQFNRLESMFNNLVISLLEVAANIGEFLGADVSGARSEIARLTEGQLAFDLQVAETEEELQGIVQRAIDRGVDASGISEALGIAVGDLVSEGDIERAQILVDTLQEAGVGEFETEGLSPVGKELTEGAENATDAIRRLQERITELRDSGTDLGTDIAATLEQDIATLKIGAIDTTTSQAAIETGIEALNAQLTDAINNQDWDLTRSIADDLGIDNINQVISDRIRGDIQSFQPPEQDAESAAQKVFLAFSRALGEGNFETAGAYANLLPEYDETFAYSHAVDTVRAYSDQLTTAFDDAIAAGDLELAESLYNIISVDIPEDASDPFLEQLNTLRETTEETMTDMGTDTTTFTDAANDALISTQTELENTNDRVGTLGMTVTTNIPPAQQAFKKFLDSIATGSNPAIGMLVSLATQFSSIAGSVNSLNAAAAAAGAGGAGGTPGGRQAGGIAPAGIGFWAGEDGPEFISSDERLSVLNARSSAAMMSSMQAMMAGSPTYSMNMSAPRSQTNQFVFNTQSPADTTNRLLETVDSMRGFT